MKITFTRSVLTIALLGVSTALFAQNTVNDTTSRFQKKSFRTFSIGLNAGMLTHYTPFNGPANGDFRTPEEKLGYGGYIKQQILPGFGIQADFLAGKVNGYRANSLATGSQAQDNSSFESRIDWSGSCKRKFYSYQFKPESQTQFIIALYNCRGWIYVFQRECQKCPGW